MEYKRDSEKEIPGKEPETLNFYENTFFIESIGRSGGAASTTRPIGLDTVETPVDFIV